MPKKLSYPESTIKLTEYTETLLSRFKPEFGNLYHIRVNEVYAELQALKKSFIMAVGDSTDKQTSEKVLGALSKNIGLKESYLQWLLEQVVSPK